MPLEGFCWLAVGLDVKDRVSLKSIPLHLIVLRNVISLPEISAVNLIEGWNWFACSMNKMMNNWVVIQNQPLLKSIYTKLPIISYKRGKSLKDTLLRAKI